MALDTEELVHLNDAQKERYMLLERLFEHPSWPAIMAWAEINANEQTSRLIFCKTWDENRMAAGARAAYTHLLNIENVTDLEFKAYAEQNKSEKSESIADDVTDNE